jgi:tRNA U34 5-carboxymethylaminomethyl modifying GTPase MnmE/TrmE
VLTDTAGIRLLQEAQGHEKIETEGIQMAKEELKRAHGVIFVIDATSL